MTAALARLRARSDRTLVALVTVIVAAWAYAAWAEVSGGAAELHHHRLFESVQTGGLPLIAAVLITAGAWQLMTAAMMLPTSVPMIRIYATATRMAPSPRLSLTLFLLAYFLIWTAFAVVASIGDMGLHVLVDSWQWLGAHQSIIPGATLGLAATWQLTPLKDACLRECRHPAIFIQRHYRRGPLAAWALGLRHGLFCLGCCWALMLVMFAAGVAHLAWMGALTLVMLAEKTFPGGDRLARPIGLAFGALAVYALVSAVPGL